MSVESTKDGFSASFSLITAIVYLIIAMVAALAFVVLFTLSTTNITERLKELATIKILGLPDGYDLSKSLTYVLNIPSFILQ